MAWKIVGKEKPKPEAKLSKMPIAKEIDVLGELCPYPLLATEQALKKLNPGDILKVLSDTTSSVTETIPEFCQKHGYPMEVVKNEEEMYWELYIMKKGEEYD